MDLGASDDPYAVLGVERGATAAEIRRAYRMLALRLHPDRAGAAGTESFQRATRAYRILGDAAARAAHDAATAPRRPAAPDRPRATTGPRVHILPRFAAPLARLIERGIARRRADGVIELGLTADEARRGGTTAFGVPLRVPCPTCGGCAQRGEVWCVRCEFEGAIDDEVTVALAIPPDVADGAMFTIHFDDAAETPPLRVRIRQADATANW